MFSFNIICFCFLVLIFRGVESVSNGKSYEKSIRFVHDSSLNKFFLVRDSGHATSEFPNGHPSAKQIAWAGYSNTINSTGWAILEITTDAYFSDSQQAYAASYVEGYLTRELIEMHKENTIGNFCGGQEAYCAKLKNFLNENLDAVKNNVTKFRSSDPYWHHVGLVLEQLAGLQDGVNGTEWPESESELEIGSREPHMNVDVFDVYLFNIAGDLEDLELVLNKPGNLKRVLGSGSCSALIKVLPDNSDLYVSQDTWNDFASMLRIIKHFNFSYHYLPSESSLVPGQSISFSSYPGTLQSGDDFYVISSGLVTLETTIGNSNMKLYQSVKAEKIVLEWVRSIVANKLAHNGTEWSQIFSQHNSGTYNNQWMIVDYKLFTPGTPLKNNLITVLEQIPTLIVYDDVTDVLRNQSYWPSYNTPYFPSVFNLSGSPANVIKYGDWFTYDKTPRALIFKRDNKNVTNVESMTKLMRYNNYQHDPLSRCNCTPPYSAENAIAARSDLNPANGTYEFSALGHRSHGATDMKLTTYELQKRASFIAVGGPPHDDVPPFQWSTSDFKNTVKHKGHPDLWVFKPIQPIF